MALPQSQYVCDRVSRGDEWEYRASKVDVTTFTSSKSLTLTAMRFCPLTIVPCTSISREINGPWADISIVETDPSTCLFREIYTTRRLFILVNYRENVVQLERPITIMERLKYEIRVKMDLHPMQPLEYDSCFRGHEEDIVLKNGARIRFDCNHGMVHQLFFASEFDFKGWALIGILVLCCFVIIFNQLST